MTIFKVRTFDREGAAGMSVYRMRFEFSMQTSGREEWKQGLDGIYILAAR